MKRRQRQAIILDLMDKLKEQGSWCGETHLQKAVYFLVEFADVPLELEFVLYKHGPFSFELRDEITAMRADGLIKLQPQPYPYGPSLVTTDSGRRLKERWPKTLNKYRDRIASVATLLGGIGVVELEPLATALYITREHPDESVDNHARRLHKLKPHISIDKAKVAIYKIDQMLEERNAIN